MLTQPLGDSDVDVSRIGLGCNNFGSRIDFERTREVVDAALEAGVTFFDTADVYGNSGDSERFLGELLEGRREQAVVATKFGADMGTGDERRGSRDYVRRALAITELEGRRTRLRSDADLRLPLRRMRRAVRGARVRLERASALLPELRLGQRHASLLVVRNGVEAELRQLAPRSVATAGCGICSRYAITSLALVTSA